MLKNKKIEIDGQDITIISQGDDDYMRGKLLSVCPIDDTH